MAGPLFVRNSLVSKPARTEELLPGAPRSSWDGWFAIGIFPPGSAVRWAKSHLFRYTSRPGRHPLAAVEGFGDSSEVMTAWATPEEVTVLRREVEAGTLESSLDPLRVALADRFLLEGEAPRYRMDFSLAEDAAAASFDFETGWPVRWASMGPVLSYLGQHSTLRLEITRGNTGIEAYGFGVTEHVRGMSLPFDFARVAPLHFHWDVLSFQGTGSTLDSAAGLSIGSRGRTLIPLASVVALPGASPRAMHGLRVRYNELSLAPGEDGTPTMVPEAWEGDIRARDGEFSYRATRATPVAFLVPGGGMLGFDFAAEWRPRVGNTLELSGVGFSEYGDFSGRLARLAVPSRAVVPAVQV